MTQRNVKPIKLSKGWKTEQWLNQEQEAFCQCYVNSDKEFFGNWVQSYIEVYGPDKTAKNWYKNACAAASQILTSTKVIARINELLEEWWLNDQNVDKQLSFLITQFDDKGSKLAAIKEYNRLKARVIEKWAEVNIYNLSDLSPKELEERRKELLK